MNVVPGSGLALAHDPHPLQMVVLMDPGEDAEDALRTHRSREKTFIFDTVFDQHATQVSREDLLASWSRYSPQGLPRALAVGSWIIPGWGIGGFFVVVVDSQVPGFIEGIIHSLTHLSTHPPIHPHSHSSSYTHPFIYLPFTHQSFLHPFIYIHIPIHPSIIYPSNHPFVHPSIQLYISAHSPLVHSTICPFIKGWLYPSVCSLIHPSIHQSFHLSILFIHPLVHLTIHQSIQPSIHPSIHVYPSVHPSSIHPFIYLSIIYPSIPLFMQ